MNQEIDLLAGSLDLDPPARDETSQVETVRHLSLRLRDQHFAIEIRHVREIVSMQPITPVHDVSSYVKGLMNLRGHVIPLIDTGERLGLCSRAHDERTCIVVLQLEDLDDAELGLIVDRVDRVIDLPLTPEEDTRGSAGRNVQRHGDEVVVCLDPIWLASATALAGERAGAEQ